MRSSSAIASARSLGVQRQRLAHRDQGARRRVLEPALGQREGGVGAGAGQPRRVARHQPRDHRQAGPGMRRQVLHAGPLGLPGRAAGQRDRHHQLRRVRPVLERQFGLQRHHAVFVADLPGQAGARDARAAARRARRFRPGDDRGAVGDHGQVPAGQLRPAAAHQQPAAAGQVLVGLEARRAERLERQRPPGQRQRRPPAARRRR